MSTEPRSPIADENWRDFLDTLGPSTERDVLAASALVGTRVIDLASVEAINSGYQVLAMLDPERAERFLTDVSSGRLSPDEAEEILKALSYRIDPTADYTPEQLERFNDQLRQIERQVKASWASPSPAPRPPRP